MRSGASENQAIKHISKSLGCPRSHPRSSGDILKVYKEKSAAQRLPRVLMMNDSYNLLAYFLYLGEVHELPF